MLATYFTEVILLKVQAWECIKNNKVKSSSSLGHLKKKTKHKNKNSLCVCWADRNAAFETACNLKMLVPLL